MRNDASHKGVVSDKSFRIFYERYVDFFNNHLPSLLCLKSESKVLPKYSEPSLPKRKGVLLTDSRRIAAKYGCNQKIIIRIVRDYIDRLRHLGVVYNLLDVAEPRYANQIPNSGGWHSYHRIITSFHRHEGLNKTVALFIVGGQDVIPMPVVSNPAAQYVNATDYSVEADILYAYPAETISLTPNSDFDINSIHKVDPLYYVSRLPMESGAIESDPTQDLKSYFTKALYAHNRPIAINRVGAVSMEISRNTMLEMLKGVNLCDLNDFGYRYRQNDIFVSPDIRLEGNVDNTVVDKYTQRMQDCELLSFLLHGSSQSDIPGFYGEGRLSGQVEAYSPSMLGGKNKIVVPICCWGARFIGFRRKESALLMAMFNTDVVLYLGACRSSIGSIDNVSGENELGVSNYMLRLYIMNIMSGVPAAEALYKAKIGLINHKITNKSDCAFELLTFLEFNQFGDPLLHATSTMSAQFNHDAGRHINFEYKPPETKIIYERSAERESMLNRVRSLVDRNLADIRNRINELLYLEYGIESSALDRIIQIGTHDNIRYRFVYRGMNKLNSSQIAHVDSRGNLVGLYVTC